ncbi:membrane hypothetical protein [Limnobacter sp. 130]|uniref:hypothetical protein n=1 Tax=Limnobacter sp. 130 TaxID=2653147 RepID=UPI0012F30DB3|nr:hypothetical protein [Limnobacter sp. 130]VWX35570.1 membrane hypothetical protein [Limnobacter sp. 130]
MKDKGFRSLHWSFYSALSGVSFVGLMTSAQLHDRIGPSWLYDPLLALFGMSTVIMATFAIVHLMILEREDEDVYLKLKARLQSRHAGLITGVGLLIFGSSFLLMVLALSVQAFLIVVLTLIVMRYCVARFFSAHDDDFLG